MTIPVIGFIRNPQIPKFSLCQMLAAWFAHFLQTDVMETASRQPCCGQLGARLNGCVLRLPLLLLQLGEPIFSLLHKACGPCELFWSQLSLLISASWFGMRWLSATWFGMRCLWNSLVKVSVLPAASHRPTECSSERCCQGQIRSTLPANRPIWSVDFHVVYLGGTWWDKVAGITRNKKKQNTYLQKDCSKQ